MPIDISGMFTTPNEIKAARINQLMQEQSRNAASGGSINDLLGQVAAMGNVTGGALLEAGRGMLDITTPAEAKAAELQAMAESGAYDLNTSEGLANFAKDLNGLGYTKEALAIMGKRNEVLDSEIAAEDRAIKKDQGVPPRVEERTVPVIRTYKGKPVLDENDQPIYDLEKVKIYKDWNPETRKWEERGKSATSEDGGMNFHDANSFNAYLMKRYGGQP